MLFSPAPHRPLSALQQDTRTIPIVFVIVPDPVGRGLVTSLARPGGIITGFASYDASIIGKRAQLLKEAVPGVTRACIIFNPDTALAPPLDPVVKATACTRIWLAHTQVWPALRYFEAMAPGR